MILLLSLTAANQNLRKLDNTKINLAFIDAYDLFYSNPDSTPKWTFKITYSVVETVSTEQYITPILYNGNPSKATCQKMGTDKLNCELTEDSQKKDDLIQISNSGSDDANINWISGLDGTFTIPIITNLKYVNSNSLKYTSTSKAWEFKVKISDTDILPQNGVVKIDLTLDKDYLTKETATCTHNSHYLSCNFVWERTTYFLIKIAPKNSGTVDWDFGTIDDDWRIIPFDSTMENVWHYNNMELNSKNRWVFDFGARINESIGGKNNAFTINTKIEKKNGQTLYYYTRCYSNKDEISSKDYTCTIYGDNQEKTDLVYVSNKTDVNDVNVNWGTVLKNDEVISRKAELTFKKIYGLNFVSPYWEYKIDVSDDDDLPDNAKVWIDTLIYANMGNIYTECSLLNHVLKCSMSGSQTGSTGLILFQSEKKVGSVTWKNLKEKYIYIPLEFSATFTNTFGAMFTNNKWNFMISTSFSNDYPNNSRVKIDILHNSEATTATCRLVHNKKLYCFSDYATQASTDTIIIRYTKISGSVTWSSSFSDTPLVKSTFVDSETQMSFVDAKNLNYANHKWAFNIIARSTTPDITKKYKVDITVNRSGKYTAHCLLYITSENPDTELVCSCAYPNQSKDDLITIAKTKHDSTSTSIKWTTGIEGEDDPPITLDTELIFNKFDSLAKDSRGRWTFKILLNENNNYILPVYSKVIADISNSKSSVVNSANCTVESKTKLSCSSEDATSEPDFSVNYKSLKGSILWVDEVTEKSYPELPIKNPNELEFVKAYNLIFASQKWTFSIIYALEDIVLTQGTKLTTPILYKTSPSKANCEVKTIERLDCDLNDQNDQAISDLIQISNSGSSAADIKWVAGLVGVYNIVINATLNYVDSYDLTYDTTTYNWNFKVKIKETDSFPENGALIIDISLTNSEETTAKCTHNNHYLTCNFIWNRANTYLIKIAPKKYGSVNWNNLGSIEDNLKIIPLKSKMSTASNGLLAYNLYLNEGHWEFTLGAKLVDTNGGLLNSFTMNSKIEKNGVAPLYYYTRCYSNSNDLSPASYSCKIYGDNQVITDLVSVSTKTDVNEVGLDWDGKLSQDKIINRNAILTFKRIYDYNFDSSDRYWYFKIDVENDENLPENAEVRVDIMQWVNKGTHYKECSFQNHILTCKKSASTSSSTDLELFHSVREKGSVIWTNLREKYIYIPLNTSLTFSETSGAIFTNKWNFMILTTDSDSYPAYSKVLIDILHNDEETTASCSIVKDKYLYCFSDFPTQSPDDQITIKYTKKYGSITWKTSFTDAPLVEGTLATSQTTMIFKDAYNLNFANNKWSFTINAQATITNINRKARYPVDIIVKKSSDTENKISANCLIYITKETYNTQLICSCPYEEQSKDDLITIAYPKHDSTSSSIKWSSGITKNYPITLNTELTYDNIGNYQKLNNKWNFDINLLSNENYVLPLNSKLIVDIKGNKRVNCTATSKTVLLCVSDTSSSSKQPTIEYEPIKSLDSSVTWLNEIEVPSNLIPTPEPEDSTDESEKESDQESEQESNQESESESKPDKEPKNDNKDLKDSSKYLKNIKLSLLLILILV